MLRTAVIGVGSLGRHHARIHHELSGAHLVAVVDPDRARAEDYAGQFNCEALTDARDLRGRVDAVSVAAPTVDHASIGTMLLESGVACLIEKPIASSLEEADQLIAASKAGQAVLQVGHIERFNPAVVAAAKVITTPRFIECHRLAEFTPRSLDIDVVMDLMIHDIDIILSLVGADVADIRAAGIGVLTARIDIANARLEFENGCIANVTASRVSAERVRKLRLFQPRDYISIDTAGKEVQRISVAPPSAGDARPVISAGMLEIDDVEPLKAEIASFLGAVRGEHPVVVSGDDGRRALVVAVRILESIAEHAGRVGLQHGAIDGNN